MSCSSELTIDLNIGEVFCLLLGLVLDRVDGQGAAGALVEIDLLLLHRDGVVRGILHRLLLVPGEDGDGVCRVLWWQVGHFPWCHACEVGVRSDLVHPHAALPRVGLPVGGKGQHSKFGQKSSQEQFREMTKFG